MADETTSTNEETFTNEENEQQVERRKKQRLRDMGWNERWKPIFSFVYVAICLFDFIVVPTFVGITRDKYQDLIPLVKDFSPEVQVIVLERKTWQPITLQGNGLIHLAFGAILGVVAWKGKE